MGQTMHPTYRELASGWALVSRARYTQPRPTPAAALAGPADVQTAEEPVRLDSTLPSPDTHGMPVGTGAHTPRRNTTNTNTHVHTPTHAHCTVAPALAPERRNGNLTRGPGQESPRASLGPRNLKPNAPEHDLWPGPRWRQARNKKDGGVFWQSFVWQLGFHKIKP